MTSTKNNTTITTTKQGENTMKTEKTMNTDTINAISMISVKNALEHYNISVDDIKWEGLKKSDRHLGGMAAACLKSDIAYLTKSIASKINSAAAEGTTEAKKAALLEDVEELQLKQADKQAVLDGLNADNIEIPREIAVYAYGIGGGKQLYIPEEELKIILEKCDTIRKYAKLHREKMALLADEKRDNASTKGLYANLKLDMQEIYDLVSPDTKCRVKSDDVTLLCTNLLKDNIGMGKNWNIKDGAGLSVAYKETVLRTICKACGMQYAKREITIQ